MTEPPPLTWKERIASAGVIILFSLAITVCLSDGAETRIKDREAREALQRSKLETSWQGIQSPGDSESVLYRTRTPGGWIIYGSRTGDVVYVPDLEGTWLK